MDEQTRRTARFIGEEAHHSQQESQQRQQETQRRETAATQTYESISKGQLGDSKNQKTTADKAYQYLLGEKLAASKGKPLDKETDVTIAKQLIKISDGKESGKIRDAIINHSSLASRVSENQRKEYADVVTLKAYQQYLKDVPREEKTRVQTKCTN
jgi:hypothetical protein